MNRRGLSLLEVMLALAIFGTSLAILGELVRLGALSAVAARDMTYAQLHCESLMAEITAGVRPADAVSESPIEVDPDWLYTVDVEAASQQGLVAVTVKVERNQTTGRRRNSFTLLRWIPDPSIELSAESDSATTPSTSSSSTSSAAAPAGGASGS